MSLGAKLHMNLGMRESMAFRRTLAGDIKPVCVDGLTRPAL